jgi:O-antigen ligase
MKLTAEQIISAVFAMLVVFTALAHGVVEPWSELIFVLAVAAIVLLWAFKIIREKRMSLFIPANLWPLVGLILLGLVQGNRVFSGVGLSLDVEATQGTTLMLCCLLVTSLAAANFLTHRERLQTLMQFLTIFGLVLATFSMIQYFTSSDKFYWIRAVESKTSFGSFVNRNHFAGYLELLLPWPVALMMTRRRSLAEKSFYLFIAAWMVVVAVFSLSRGGMISVFAQLIFLATFRPRQFDEVEPASLSSGVMRFARQAALATVFLVTIFGGLNWLGAERVIDRVTAGFETNPAVAAQNDTRPLFTGHRNELWRDSWKIFAANPLIGAGLGAYETALPAHNQNRNLGMIASQAHNDYLQTLTDAGLIGALLAIWFLAVTARAVMKALRVHEPLMSSAAFGCGAALFGLSVHSLFDFNLQLLSHSLLFLAFAAIVSQLSELATLINAARVRPAVAVR